jgi:hypothetical protein
MTTLEITLPELLVDRNWAQVFADENDGNVDKSTQVIPPGANVDPTPPSRTDVAEIIAAVNGENDGDDWVGLFLLKDGRYLIAEGGCDYTGWDCQAGNSLAVAGNINDAIRLGLNPEQQQRLGIRVEPEVIATRYMMPPEMYPVHMFHPEFETLQLWFPALDAWVLEMLCRKVEDKFYYEGRHNLTIMEIGSYVGCSTSVLEPHASYLLCVDTWAGSGKAGDEMAPLYAVHGEKGKHPFEVFQKNTAGFKCKPVCHQRTLNPDSLPGYLDGKTKFDLIFIDGAHDYESVKADIEIATRHIVPGGIICGHDFNMFKGVSEAAIEFEVDAICGTVWWKEML